MIQRIRTIKPELARHEVLYDLEHQLKMPVRFAWAMLFTVCDREGRFKWRPRELKTMVLPYDDCDFGRVLDAFATRGFIVKYESGGEEFGYIPTWKEHQVINGRESASKLPAPQGNKQIHALDASATRDPRVTHADMCMHVGNGTEGNRTTKSSSVAVEGLSDKAAPQAAVRLAALLKSEILKNAPKAKITQAHERNWAKAADRMIRLDHRSEEEIAALIRWAQADEFWQSNILSMDKLREKFDQLVLKSGISNGPAGRPNGNSAWDPVAATRAELEGPDVIAG